jgi:hypothetical protein
MANAKHTPRRVDSLKFSIVVMAALLSSIVRIDSCGGCSLRCSPVLQGCSRWTITGERLLDAGMMGYEGDNEQGIVRTGTGV